MNSLKKAEDSLNEIKPYILALTVGWSVIVCALLMWNVYQERQEILDLARIQARVAYEKDIIYRRWNADHGGVYVPVSDKTQPNQYLGVPERDIITPSGVELTLMNPAYMTRQVHDLGAKAYGVRGHITSLKPIRPENAPDRWETKALEAFERGETEASSVEKMGREDYMRLMSPLPTEKGCLKCHARQGYEVGDIRGGISVSVPMAVLRAIERSHVVWLSLGYGALCLLGLAGICLGGRRLREQISERRQAEEEQKRFIIELKDALAKVKTLSGMLPICSSCKKIRDDKGYWNQIEAYIRNHSEVEFSHSICPDCAKKLYPDF